MIQTTDNPKIAFISGCFDGGPHPGHLHILHEMNKLTSFVIVAINDDDYIRRKKGRDPLQSQEEREFRLYATGLVSQVVPYSGDSPLEIIKDLKPAFIVVGDDYTEDRVVGAKECGEWGGKVVIIPRLPGFSTTKVAEKKDLEREVLNHFDAALLLETGNRNHYGYIFTRVLELSCPQNILEIGFFSGNSALCWLHLGDAKLTSVDPMRGMDGQGFDGKIENVDVLKGFFGDRFTFLKEDSKLVRPSLEGQKFDLIYIDGDHSVEGARNDIQLALDFNISWVLIDDFASSVAEAFDAFSDRFEFVEEFNRDSSGQTVAMRLFRRKG